MNIRRATANDAPTLAKVHVDSWQVAYRGIVPDTHLERFTYERREEAFRQALAANLEETYLIEDDDQAVGILTIGASRDADLDANRAGEIWGIYITPSFWRRGIGTTLVHEAERMLQSRGYQEVVLWVLEANMDARRFYEKMGFGLDGMNKIVELGKPLKAVRYKKVMNDPSMTH
jgi:ribosomal protein S18 acetylase RimI-like enzyme